MNPQRAVGRSLRSLTRRRAQDRTCWLLLGLAIAWWAAVGMWLTRGTTFFYDEFTYFVASRGYDPSAILAPHNGHLIAVPRLIYATAFEFFGANYLAFRVLEVLGVALVAVIFFTLIRRRIGSTAALAPSILLLFFGSAAEQVTLSPLGITHVYCIAAGIAALLALESDRKRADLAGCALLVICLATFSIGFAFVAGTAVSVLLRGDRVARAWIFLVPLALYGVWLLAAPGYSGPTYGTGTGFRLANVPLIPNFAADSAAAVAGAISGLRHDFAHPETADVLTPVWGYVLAAAGGSALVQRLRRGRIPPSLWVSLAIMVAFWASAGAVSGLNRYPYSQRYLYAGAIAVFLVAAEALRETRFTRSSHLWLFGVLAVALGVNATEMRSTAGRLRSGASTLRAAMTSIDLAGPHAASTFSPGDPRLFLPSAAVLTVGGPRAYLAAARRNGSFAFTLAELRTQPEDVREEADSALVGALHMAPVAAPAPASQRRCAVIGAGRGGPVSFTARSPGIIVRAPVAEAVLLRRFAAVPAVTLGRLEVGSFFALAIPADRARDPWQIVVPTGPLTICEPDHAAA